MITLILGFIAGYYTNKIRTNRSNRVPLSDFNDVLDQIQEQLEEIKELGFEDFERHITPEISISDLKKMFEESPSLGDAPTTPKKPTNNEGRE